MENLYKETTEIHDQILPAAQEFTVQQICPWQRNWGIKPSSGVLPTWTGIRIKQPTRKEAFDKLLSRIHPGAIVLLHNTSSTNGQILDELLTKWEEMGYTFGTLNDF